MPAEVDRVSSHPGQRTRHVEETADPARHQSDHRTTVVPRGSAPFACRGRAPV